MTSDATVIEYCPCGAALALWKCKAPEVLIEGPAGTGKTRGIWEKILALADKYPGSRHLVCRKTRDSMTDSVLVTFEEKVLPPNSAIKAGPKRDNRHSYTLPNGSEIVLGGLDKPSRTFSAEYDTVVVFEAIEITEDEWELLHRSLRNGKMPYAQAIADTNPGPKGHWLNRRAESGKMARLLSRHEDNPAFYDADAKDWTPQGRQYIARLDGLSGHRKLRMRHGIWASAEGVIYEEFDTALHLIDRFEIPSDWRRFRSIDFGVNDPFVCQWWAVDPDKRMYLYREIYMSGRLVEDHAKGVRNEAGEVVKQGIVGLSAGEKIQQTAADHDAEDRMTLERHGVRTVLADKSILTGISAVAERLRKAIDGKPRIFILRDSLVEFDSKLEEAKRPTKTADEFDAYVWKKGINGKPTKDEPEDADNHGMDAMRYAVMLVDQARRLALPAASRVREFG